MARLSTHVLDTSRGRPAAGVKVHLSGPTNKTVTTDDDGRALVDENLAPGIYDLVFAVGSYFGTAKFLDDVVVRFRIAEGEARYHVPLLVSPYGYTTYRGS